MERRLQLLLDQQRYDLVAGEAEASGRSVASVIREAIDLRFADDVQARRSAAARLLAGPSDESPEPEWAVVKADLESDVLARGER